MSEQLPDGGMELSAAEIDALEARWSSSWTPNQVAGCLAGIATPWYVAGGWAVDLFLGRQTRAHGDIEIAVPAGSFTEVRRRFPGFAFDAVGSGRIWENATAAELAAGHQTWVRDRSTGNYVLDVFREPHEEDTWICRRDASTRCRYDEIIQRTQDGVPYLAPELVLLFKAKNVRPKDQADFDVTLPRLTPAQRRTLGELLKRVHPGHRWLAVVSTPPRLSSVSRPDPANDTATQAIAHGIPLSGTNLPDVTGATAATWNQRTVMSWSLPGRGSQT